MKAKTIIGQTMLAGNTACKVLYHPASDTVEVAVGCTSLRFEADHFIVMHEMLRKAAAKIVMQTSSKVDDAHAVPLSPFVTN